MKKLLIITITLLSLTAKVFGIRFSCLILFIIFWTVFQLFALPYLFPFLYRS